MRARAPALWLRPGVVGRARAARCRLRPASCGPSPRPVVGLRPALCGPSPRLVVGNRSAGAERVGTTDGAPCRAQASAPEPAPGVRRRIGAASGTRGGGAAEGAVPCAHPSRPSGTIAHTEVGDGRRPAQARAPQGGRGAGPRERRPTRRGRRAKAHAGAGPYGGGHRPAGGGAARGEARKARVAVAVGGGPHGRGPAGGGGGAGPRRRGLRGQWEAQVGRLGVGRGAGGPIWGRPRRTPGDLGAEVRFSQASPARVRRTAVTGPSARRWWGAA